MRPVAEELKTTLSTLSQEERAELAHYLIVSLDDGRDTDVDEAWQAEIANRLDDISSGRELGVDSDTVIARAKAMISRRRRRFIARLRPSS